jgi:hypothetical protein
MKAIPLTKGYVALVDDADYARVAAFKWRAMPWTRADGSISVRAARSAPRGGPKRGLIYMHAFICGYPRPDHADGDGLNNQRYNLRPASDEQNGANRRKTRGLTSVFLGVNRNHDGWVARIRKDRKYIGYFHDEADAATAYNFAALELYGEFARFNAPEMRSGK